MTKSQLYKKLNDVNSSREKRSYYADLVIENPKLIKPLLEILFEVDTKISIKAAWIFEFVCSYDSNLSIPYLGYFTEHISKVYLDSAVRPIAKVCEILVKNSFTTPNSEIKKHLTKQHKERMTEACFDWLLGDEKVAVKAYSMHTLYLLGNEFDWIHPELKVILQRDFALQISGYKARARHILKKI